MRMMKLIWIMYFLLTVEGNHPLVCPDGRNIANYNGSVAITNTGKPCKNWSEIDPTSFSVQFVLATLRAPKNYCRNILGEVGCPTYWPGSADIENCHRSICGFENFADVYYGGFVTSGSGWLAANNPDVKGCHWVLQAPIGVVIDVSVLYLYTNDFRSQTDGRCEGSYLSIFETDETIQDRFCGNVTPTVRSRSNELFIRYRAGYYAWRNERFNLTYLHILQGFFPNRSADLVTDNTTAESRTMSAQYDTSSIHQTSSASSLTDPLIHSSDQQSASENRVSATQPVTDITKKTEANGCSAVKSVLLVLCPMKALFILS